MDYFDGLYLIRVQEDQDTKTNLPSVKYVAEYNYSQCFFSSLKETAGLTDTLKTDDSFLLHNDN